MKTVSLVYHPEDVQIARYIGRVLKRRDFRVRGVALSPSFTTEMVADQLKANIRLVVLLTPAVMAMPEHRWIAAQADIIPVIAAPVENGDLFPEINKTNLIADRQAALSELLRILSQIPDPEPPVRRTHLAAMSLASAMLIAAILIISGLLSLTIPPAHDMALPTRAVSKTSAALGDGDAPAVIAGDQATGDRATEDFIAVDTVDTQEDALKTAAADGLIEDDTAALEDEVYADFMPDPYGGPAPLEVSFQNLSSGPIAAYLWDFDGDGETDSTDEIPAPHTYGTPGDYEITLTVLDSDGNEATWTDYITVYEGEGATSAEADDDEVDADDVNTGVLTADFTMNPRYGDAPLTVNFTDNSTGDIVRHAWDLNGDGSIDSQSPNPSYTYEERDEFAITLTVEDAEGNTDSFTDFIAIGDSMPPDVFFTASPDYGMAPLTVSFSNESSGAITAYEWDLDGDGRIDSTAETPNDHTFAEGGEYEITLTASGPGGTATASYFIFVDAHEEPFVFMSPDPYFGIAPLTVTFDLDEYGVIDRYEWDFDGDGSVDSTRRNPAPHTYTQPGSYKATLNAFGPGGTASDSLTIDVEAQEPPFAGFDVTPWFGTAPLIVSFTDYSFGTISSYQWDFDGDGSIDSTARTPPNHTFTQPGDYEVSLTVTGPGGTSTYSVTISVAPADDTEDIRAAFSVTPATGTAPLPLTIRNLTEGTVARYEWDFESDGVVDSTQIAPSGVMLQTPGTYTIMLTAYDSDNTPFTATQTVTVTAAPLEARFTTEPVAPISGEVGLRVTFTSTTLPDDGLTYAWDFNGDTLVDATTASAQFTYTAAGTFTPTLTLTRGDETATASTTVTIVEPEIAPDAPPEATLEPAPLEARFTTEPVAPISGEVGLSVTFTSTTPPDDGLTYAWDFNGDTLVDATTASAQFTYTAAGTFTPTLTLTRGDETATASTTVTIVEPEIAPDAPPEATPEATLEPAPLEARFTTEPVAPISGEVGLSVTFTSTTPPDDGLTYAWDFNGDTLVDATTASAQFTYTAAGTFTPTLTLTRGDETATASTTVTIVEPEIAPDTPPEATPEATLEPTPLEARFTTEPVAPISGEVGLRLTFTSTTPPDDGLTYAWDFNGSPIFPAAFHPHSRASAPTTQNGRPEGRPLGCPSCSVGEAQSSSASTLNSSNRTGSLSGSVMS